MTAMFPPDRDLQRRTRRSDICSVQGEQPISGQGGVAVAGAALVALGGPWLAIALEAGGSRGPLFLTSVAVVALGVGMLLLRLVIAVPPVGAQLRRVEASWSAVGPEPAMSDRSSRSATTDGGDHHAPAAPTSSPA
jgi:hypothetical protein